MNKKLLFGSALALGAAAVLGASMVSGQGNVIRIGGYDGPTDTALTNELITKFVKPAVAKDGVDVQYVPTADYGKNIVNQLSAGTAPDIMYLEDFAAQGLIATGKIMALTGQVDTKPFLPSLNRVFTQNGKVYGIAKDFNTLTLYYNKDLFDQAKVAYPDDKDNWASFEQKITKVQEALGKGFYGTCFPADYARFGAFAAATGWRPILSSGKTILDSRFKAAFTWYTNLVKKGVAAQPSQVNAGWGGDCIKSGKVATAFEGAWALGFLRDNAPNLKYGTSLLPTDPSGKRGNLIYTVAWAINNDSKNKAAAVKVLQALTSTEAQQFVLRGGLALPSRSSLQDDQYLKGTTPEQVANRNVFRGASEGNAVSYAPDKYGNDWFTPINEALKAVMDGTKSVDAAIKDAQTRINQVMSK